MSVLSHVTVGSGAAFVTGVVSVVGVSVEGGGTWADVTPAPIARARGTAAAISTSERLIGFIGASQGPMKTLLHDQPHGACPGAKARWFLTGWKEPVKDSQ